MRRHRPVKLPTLLDEAKALAPIKDAKAPLLLEVLEVTLAATATMLLEEAKGHIAGEGCAV